MSAERTTHVADRTSLELLGMEAEAPSEQTAARSARLPFAVFIFASFVFLILAAARLRGAGRRGKGKRPCYLVPFAIFPLA